MADDPDAYCLGLRPELQHYPGGSFGPAGLAVLGPGHVLPPSLNEEFPVGRELYSPLRDHGDLVYPP